MAQIFKVMEEKSTNEKGTDLEQSEVKKTEKRRDMLKKNAIGTGGEAKTLRKIQSCFTCGGSIYDRSSLEIHLDKSNQVFCGENCREKAKMTHYKTYLAQSLKVDFSEEDFRIEKLKPMNKIPADLSKLMSSMYAIFTFYKTQETIQTLEEDIQSEKLKEEIHEFSTEKGFTSTTISDTKILFYQLSQFLIGKVKFEKSYNPIIEILGCFNQMGVNLNTETISKLIPQISSSDNQQQTFVIFFLAVCYLIHINRRNEDEIAEQEHSKGIKEEPFEEILKDAGDIFKQTQQKSDLIDLSMLLNSDEGDDQGCPVYLSILDAIKPKENSQRYLLVRFEEKLTDSKSDDPDFKLSTIKVHLLTENESLNRNSFARLRRVLNKTLRLNDLYEYWFGCIDGNGKISIIDDSAILKDYASTDSSTKPTIELIRVIRETKSEEGIDMPENDDQPDTSSADYFTFGLYPAQGKDPFCIRSAPSNLKDSALVKELNSITQKINFLKQGRFDKMIEPTDQSLSVLEDSQKITKDQSLNCFKFIYHLRDKAVKPSINSLKCPVISIDYKVEEALSVLINFEAYHQSIQTAEIGPHFLVINTLGSLNEVLASLLLQDIVDPSILLEGRGHNQILNVRGFEVKSSSNIYDMYLNISKKSSDGTLVKGGNKVLYTPHNAYKIQQEGKGEYPMFCNTKGDVIVSASRIQVSQISAIYYELIERSSED